MSVKYRIFQILYDFAYYFFGTLVGMAIISIFRPIHFYELSYALAIAIILTRRWSTVKE